MQTIDISEKEVKNFKILIEYLKQIADDGVTPSHEKYVLSILDSALPFFAHLVQEAKFNDIHRLTINKNVIGKNERIYDIKYLKYPPSEKVTNYGRCNYPKQSIFYGSISNLIALNEMNPRVGDLVTSSVWRTKTESELIYCPIFKNQPTSFRKSNPENRIINPRMIEINKLYEEKIRDYPTYIQQQIDVLIQFVADAFTKIVNPNNTLDYIFSAYFSNKIFNEFENGRIEAIYYPSVQSNLEFENIAIKPNIFDKKYDLIEVKDGFIANAPSSGDLGFFTDHLGKCNRFDYEKGEILWDNDKILRNKEILSYYKSKYGYDLD